MNNILCYWTVLSFSTECKVILGNQWSTWLYYILWGELVLKNIELQIKSISLTDLYSECWNKNTNNWENILQT